MPLRVPEFLETKRYTSRNLRAMLADTGGLQEGVVAQDVSNTDNMWADAASPTPIHGVGVSAGEAWVKADFGTKDGYYHVFNDDQVVVPVPVNLSGLPRIDQIVLRVYDEQDGPDDSSEAVFEVVRGTPTVAADTNNRFGAAELPDNCMRIADVIVDSGVATITESDIQDRRPWAHGAYFRGSSGSSQGIGSAATPGAWVVIDGANMADQFEITSGLVSVHFKCNVSSAFTTAPVFELAAMVDNVAVVYGPRRFSYSLASVRLPVNQKWLVPIAAPGRYFMGVAGSRVSGDTGSALGGTNYVEIRELLTPSSSWTWQ